MSSEEPSRVAQKRLFRSVTIVGLVLSTTLATIFVALLLGRGPGSRQRPNVIFIAVDTLRSDRLGCYGSNLDATPRIDELAAHSMRFTRTLSACNSTSSSFASLHTGTYVKTHGVIQLATFGYRLDPTLKRFAQYLKEDGYSTIGAASAFHMNGEISGLSQGFDRYLDVLDDQPKQKGGVTTDLLLEAVKTWRGTAEGEKPLFLFAHYFDPHWPYLAPPPFDSRYWTGDRPPANLLVSTDPKDLPEQQKWKDFFASQYAGEVAYADREVGRLLDGLRDLGLYDHALVLFTADHGESLGEHGVWFNHMRMYRQVTNVPLLIRLPGQAKGAVTDALAQGVDLLPTVLDYLGIATATSQIEGTSLLPVLEGRRRFVHQEIFSESANEKEKLIQQGSRKLTMLTLPHRAESDSVEFYDLDSDHDEERNLVHERGDVEAVRRDLEEKLVAFVGLSEAHLKFGPSGPKRRYRAFLKGIQSEIVSVTPADGKDSKIAPSEASGWTLLECDAGDGESHEAKILLDRAASMAVCVTADGKPLLGDELAVEGHPFDRTGLAYVVAWDPESCAEALVPAAGAVEPQCRVERVSAENGEGASLEIVIGRSERAGEVRAILRAVTAAVGGFLEPDVVRLRIFGDLGDVAAPADATVDRSLDESRLLVEAAAPRLSVRVSAARGTRQLFLEPRIGKHKVGPAALQIGFPICLPEAGSPVPILYATRYQYPLGEPAVPASFPVSIFRVGGRSRQEVTRDMMSAVWVRNMEALGYLQPPPRPKSKKPR
jgi:arylsulfatase A-like enzyme